MDGLLYPGLPFQGQAGVPETQGPDGMPQHGGRRRYTNTLMHSDTLRSTERTCTQRFTHTYTHAERKVHMLALWPQINDEPISILLLAGPSRGHPPTVTLQHTPW